MNNKLVPSERGPPLGFARSARNRIRIPIVMFRIGLGEGENYISSSILGGGAVGII